MKKAFWDKKNPNKTSKKLTPSQKTAAKARAKKAGGLIQIQQIMQRFQEVKNDSSVDT